MKFNGKKFWIASFFAASVCLASASNAARSEEFKSGYPNDPPIDVCPQEIIGYESIGAIDFTDSNTTLAGWEARGGVKLSRGAKTLIIESNTDDPYFFSPMVGSFLSEEAQAKTSGKVVVKIRARRENKGDGQIFFAERDAAEFAESRSTQFVLAKDSEFHDYIVPLDSKSPMLRLRFDIGGNEGLAEIERIELIQVVYQPIKFGLFEQADGKLSVRFCNGGGKPEIIDARCYGVDARKTYPTATLEVRGDDQFDVYYPQKKPFEEVELVATIRSSKDVFARRFFTFNESAADLAIKKGVEVPTLKSEALEVRFASDASGAEIFRSGKRVAVISPLLCEEGDGADILPDRTDFTKVDFNVKPERKGTNADGKRLTPVFRSIDADAGEIEFALCDVSVQDARQRVDAVAKKSVEIDPWKKDAQIADDSNAVDVSSVCGTLKFRLDGDVLSFDVDAPRVVHAPVIRALGTMEQATLAGCEYLEKGERSSSTADIETPEYLRYAPPIYWTTQPFSAVVTDRGSVALLYDDPKNQAIFAVPDFLDGDAASSRMNVCAKKSSGKIRVGEAFEPLEESILWSVQTRGLPDLPTPPREGDEQANFILAGFERSALKTPEGWVHALASAGPPYAFKPLYGSDFISTIWEISGKLPDVPRVDYGGGHIENYVSMLLTDNGEQLAQILRDEANSIIGKQRSDGSFHYSGKYLRGHWADYASGDCGNYLYRLIEYWRLTRDKKALEAALKGLEFANKLKTPRGAQVWELSLHTPDIMGSSRCTLANVFAYEATGDKKYLDAARRWALTGVPFVYLWEDRDLANGEQPLMKYATIAVFGATGWVSPNWMGRPVQWCGLDYAYAVLLLSKYDSTLDWAKIGEGIVASAECQLYDEEEFVGLLPDSFQMETQVKYPYNINPSVVSMLRRMIDGKPTNVSVVDVAERRVVSPYPARVEGNVVKISAEKGVAYQIMIDGKDVKTIKSVGEDEIKF